MDLSDIYLLQKQLSRKECEQLILLSESIGFEPSESCPSCVPTRSGIRNNSRIEFEDFSLAQKLWDRCKNLVPNDYDGFNVFGLCPTFKFYRYEVGEAFKPHTDNHVETVTGLKSLFTCIFYLNDNYSAGETVFYKEKNIEETQTPLLVIQPKVGNGLVFRHDWWHEGKSPSKGIKYVLRTDILYKRKI